MEETRSRAEKLNQLSRMPLTALFVRDVTLFGQMLSIPCESGGVKATRQFVTS